MKNSYPATAAILAVIFCADIIIAAQINIPRVELMPREPMPRSYQVMPTGTSVFIDEVPEPATMSLLGLGTLALLKKRKA
jgi:hypothetical protein